MTVVVGLRPDGWDLHRQQHRAGQDRCGDVVSDGDHDAVELVDAELAEGFIPGGIGANHLRELAVHGLDDLLVGVDADDLGAVRHELEGEGAAESSEADDRDRVGLGDATRGVAAEDRESSQLRASPSGTRRGSSGRGARSRTRASGGRDGRGT